ncbi:MAG: DUF2953 domain-containing protein [Roseburia sp.]
MSVVLLILKMIGLVLLVLLGILLFVLCLILFVPVRYRAEGEIDKTVRVSGRITWLFPALSWGFSFADGQMQQQLRIFGIPSRKRTRKRTRHKERCMPNGMESDEDEAEEKEAEEVGVEKEDAEGEDAALPVTRKQAATKDKSEKDRTKEIGRETFFARFKEKIRSLRTMLLEIKRTVFDEENQRAVKIIVTELFALLKHCRFRRIETELVFSLADPARTGQALGVLSMLPFLYRHPFRIYPDFESEVWYLKGTFAARGRIRMLHVLISALRILKRKECRRLFKR